MRVRLGVMVTVTVMVTVKMTVTVTVMVTMEDAGDGQSSNNKAPVPANRREWCSATLSLCRCCFC